MTNKKRAISLILIFLSVFITADDLTQQNDIPSLGVFKIPLKPTWEISEIDEIELLPLVDLVILTNNNSLLLDLSNHRFLILDQTGKLLKNFGNKGEGPGEMTMNFAMVFVAEQRIIMVDINKIIYFDSFGNFIEEKRIVLMNNPPIFFMDSSTFLHYPYFLQGKDDIKGKGILQKKLGDEKDILFAPLQYVPYGTATVNGNPVIMALDGIFPNISINGNGKCFVYGRGDRYQVWVTDLNGKELLTFGIKRNPIIIGQEEIKAELKSEGRGRLSSEIIEALSTSYPNHYSFFRKAFMLKNGSVLIWAYTPDSVGNLQLDLFDSTGKYVKRYLFQEIQGRKVLNLDLNNSKLIYQTEDKEGKTFVSCLEVNW